MYRKGAGDRQGRRPYGHGQEGPRSSGALLRHSLLSDGRGGALRCHRDTAGRGQSATLCGLVGLETSPAGGAEPSPELRGDRKGTLSGQEAPQSWQVRQMLLRILGRPRLGPCFHLVPPRPWGQMGRRPHYHLSDEKNGRAGSRAGVVPRATLESLPAWGTESGHTACAGGEDRG